MYVYHYSIICFLWLIHYNPIARRANRDDTPEAFSPEVPACKKKIVRQKKLALGRRPASFFCLTIFFFYAEPQGENASGGSSPCDFWRFCNFWWIARTASLSVWIAKLAKLVNQIFCKQKFSTGISFQNIPQKNVFCWSPNFRKHKNWLLKYALLYFYLYYYESHL